MRQEDRPGGAAPEWRSLGDYATVLRTAYGSAAGAAEPLAALRLLRAVRASLDDAELQLVENARDQRTSWARIAESLGLASRQAAEQRWLRLAGDATRDPAWVRTARRRQRFVDSVYGAEMGRLRAAVRAVHRRLSTDPDWNGRHPRAGLARSTLALAGPAEPGALFALASQAVEDLGAIPPDRLPAPLPAALDRLRRALAAATPTTPRTELSPSD